MKIAVLMDPLEHLNPKKDTTLALIQCAMENGHTVRCFTQKTLYAQEDQVFAKTINLEYTLSKKESWAYGKDEKEDALNTYDVVLMRQDPPVDSEYLYATYLLDRLVAQGVLVSNGPQAVRDMNEKLGILQFQDCIPPTLVSSDQHRLRQFWEHHHDVVFKPLYGMGGESVFHMGPSGENMNVTLDMLTLHGSRTIMAQRYIPAIQDKGDKRILMIHGEPIPYALARIPAKGDFRGNLAAGATGEVVPLTPRDQAICQAVAPVLKEKNLHFVGLDVIGDYLTEINVTSPTCLREISSTTGLDIAKTYWEGIESL
ncbi:MAG: glutathione synthase [Gammaproteobacteria bacterium]|nr:glutathione synthase [Gammaproteobacteria bacterium]